MIDAVPAVGRVLGFDLVAVTTMVAPVALVATVAPRHAESVDIFWQLVLAGALIFAKARQGAEVVRESLAQPRQYLETIFNQTRNKA